MEKVYLVQFLKEARYDTEFENIVTGNHDILTKEQLRSYNEDEIEVVDTFDKNDTFENLIKNKVVKEEFKNILEWEFGPDANNVFNYTTIQLCGEFLNIWNPEIGVEIEEDDDKTIIKITTLTKYCAEYSVAEDVFIFQDDKLIEGPDEYSPVSCEDARDRDEDEDEDD